MQNSCQFYIVLGYSRKKKSNSGRGVDDMEFPGVASKEKTWNFQGLIKNEMEFSKVTKKKCGISRGLGFWPWSFQGI